MYMRMKHFLIKKKKKHGCKGQRGRDEVAGLLKEFLMKTDIIVLFKFFKTSRV